MVQTADQAEFDFRTLARISARGQGLQMSSCQPGERVVRAAGPGATVTVAIPSNDRSPSWGFRTGSAQAWAFNLNAAFATVESPASGGRIGAPGFGQGVVVCNITTPSGGPAALSAAQDQHSS